MKRAFLVVVFGLAAVVAVWTRLPATVWYREGRPTRFGRLTNRAMAAWSGAGLPPRIQQTLEVERRRTGGVLSLPVVIAEVGGQRYLVSMLGEKAAWVANVRAAGGRAVLRSRRREDVQLEEVPIEDRAPILRAYVKRAPGARPHFDPGPGDPVDAFAAVAGAYPVFRITPA